MKLGFRLFLGFIAWLLCCTIMYFIPWISGERIPFFNAFSIIIGIAGFLIVFVGFTCKYQNAVEDEE